MIFIISFFGLYQQNIVYENIFPYHQPFILYLYLFMLMKLVVLQKIKFSSLTATV